MPTLTDNKTTLEDRFIQVFEMHEGHTLNGTNAALHGVRKEAIGHFARLGFPGRKNEAWKYTNIRKIVQREYAMPLGRQDAEVDPALLNDLRVPDLAVHLVVLVDGHFRADLSALGALPDGVIVTGLAQASEAHPDLFNAHFARYANMSGEVFTALNTAFTQDGLFVYVPKNAVLNQPIHLVSLVTADDSVMLHPRDLVVAESGAQVKLIQTTATLGDAPTFVNAVTEVFVGANAHVDLYEIQDDHDHGSAVNSVQAYQEADSVFRTSAFTLSGEVIRNHVNILPDGEGCESHMYGLFLGDGSMHVDIHTLVDHAKPNCFSNELFKGVLDDEATGVFNGKVLVRQDAQQINAYQSNKSILLSETAHMYSKPELEIYADDVKCSHGATTGQLDREGIFYLRSRGLSERQAHALMLTAFARDVLESVRIEPLRVYLDAIVSERFED